MEEALIEMYLAGVSVRRVEDTTEHPYVYLDGIVLKRSWAGEVRNVSLLVAISVNAEGYRETLGVVEGAKEDKASWGGFLKHLKERGLGGAQLIVYFAFPEEHWRWLRTNNPLERIMREIRRRTRVVGAFPDGQSALSLAEARLRHIAGTRWSTKRYLNMQLLKQRDVEMQTA